MKPYLTIHVMTTAAVEQAFALFSPQAYRFGTPLPSSEDGWNYQTLQAAVTDCFDKGSLPQLLLPLAYQSVAGKAYLAAIEQLLQEYPQAEAVFSSWGQLQRNISNRKIAGSFLQVTNREELAVLQEQGVSTVSLAENLDQQTMQALGENLPEGMSLEYHQSGVGISFCGWQQARKQADARKTPVNNAGILLQELRPAAAPETIYKQLVTITSPEVCNQLAEELSVL